MMRRALPLIAATVLLAGGLGWVAAAQGPSVIKKEGQPKKTQAKTVFPDPLPPPTDSTGLIPLTDLGTQTYKGEDGGLYGGGSNEPPPQHRAAALRELELIRPLDADGKPDADGKIVFISVGMSNTTMEFSTFKRKADVDPLKSPRVVIVDGAQGSRGSSFWANDPLRNLGADPYPVVDQRLQEAGVSPRQVQAAWIKHAEGAPHTLAQFPRMMHAQRLANCTILSLQRLRQRFPNLRVAYLSSRTYAGYAKVVLNPEPMAYEGAFAARWVIQSQVAGDPLLNFDPAKGTVMAPLVLWGPYLWTYGVKPRKSDNLVWLKEDVSARDGTHPSDSGREKVANLLLDFLHKNPLASTWFLAPGRQSTHSSLGGRGSVRAAFLANRGSDGASPSREIGY